MRKLVAIALLVALAGAFHWLGGREISRAPGVIVAAAPVQTPATDPRPFEHGDYRIQPLADFALEARVLSHATYRFDEGADLAPVDLALGWGRMSDSAVISQLEMEQSARFYTYRWQNQPPIPPREIVRSSANMHLIPASEAVARELKRIRSGDIVRLRGRLVEADRADGFRWVSSLTREDSGGGACELVYVDAIERL